MCFANYTTEKACAVQRIHAMPISAAACRMNPVSRCMKVLTPKYVIHFLMLYGYNVCGIEA